MEVFGMIVDNTTFIAVTVAACALAVILFIVSACVIWKNKLCCCKKKEKSEELDRFLATDESEDEGSKSPYSWAKDEGTFHFVDVTNIDEHESRIEEQDEEDAVVIENNVILAKSDDDGQNIGLHETPAPVESPLLDLTVSEEKAATSEVLTTTTTIADTSVPPDVLSTIEPFPNLTLDIESSQSEALPIESAIVQVEALPTESIPTESIIESPIIQIETPPTESTPPESVAIDLLLTESVATELAPTELAPTLLALAELSPADLSPGELSPSELSPSELSPSELPPGGLYQVLSLPNISTLSPEQRTGTNMYASTSDISNVSDAKGKRKVKKKSSLRSRNSSTFSKEFALNAKLKISLQYIESVKCLKGTIMSIAGLNFEVDSTPDEISFHMRFVPSKKFHIMTKYKPVWEDTNLNLTFTMGPVRKEDLITNQMRMKMYGRKSQRLTRARCFGECSYSLAEIIDKTDTIEFEETVGYSDSGTTYSSDSDVA